MSEMIGWAEEKLGRPFFDHQREAFEYIEKELPERLCFYYPTGKGKTVSSLMALKILGHDSAIAIAPPATHPAWYEQAGELGMSLECISHAKFRQKDYRMSRNRAVIADEFHLFGGHTGKGWLKLKRLGLSLEAPLILMSATPNYNDAERVYCLQSIIAPASVAGGFLQFLYSNCITEQNPFGMTPNVTGFLRYKDAASYLADIANVLYLPDELVYTIDDLNFSADIIPGFDTYGYDKRSGRMMASLMEKHHKRVFNALVDDNGFLRSQYHKRLMRILRESPTPLLVFCNHSTVAEVVSRTLSTSVWRNGLVTGDMTTKQKNAVLQEFRQGELRVLIGTASLATGTDGLDKVCDQLVILDDTDDDALRRQLIGRIMPRGVGGDSSTKRVYRFVLS